jgi:hypothetical protein
MSRIQASSVASSTTRTCGGRARRAASSWPAEAVTVTGSQATIASATAANASWAGRAPSRQVSGRSGHAIQVRSWGAHSAGIENPSSRGVEPTVVVTGPL